MLPGTLLLSTGAAQAQTSVKLPSITRQSEDASNILTRDAAQILNTGGDAGGYRLTGVDLRTRHLAGNVPPYTTSIRRDFSGWVQASFGLTNSDAEDTDAAASWSIANTFPERNGSTTIWRSPLSQSLKIAVQGFARSPGGADPVEDGLHEPVTITWAAAPYELASQPVTDYDAWVAAASTAENDHAARPMATASPSGQTLAQSSGAGGRIVDVYPAGLTDLQLMMVRIRDSYARLHERKQYRERWEAEAARESLLHTCHPGVVGGERNSPIRRKTGCLSGPLASEAALSDEDAVKANQIMFRDRVRWFGDVGARQTGVCHPGRVDRQPGSGWMLWHSCDSRSPYRGHVD